MKDYCPMQSVKKGAKYPSVLLTCGLHDSRVNVSEGSATYQFGSCLPAFLFLLLLLQR